MVLSLGKNSVCAGLVALQSMNETLGASVFWLVDKEVWTVDGGLEAPLLEEVDIGFQSDRGQHGRGCTGYDLP